jgi:hypothetical protein
LKGSPTSIIGKFWCAYNKLTNLEGGPKEVGRTFNCSHNQITSLKGAPIKVGGYFDCRDNKLITLEGAPISVSDIYCHDNPIWNIYKLFPDHKSFIESLDYNYLRGNDIVKRRFQEALDEFDIELPESIEGYDYIKYRSTYL